MLHLKCIAELLEILKSFSSTLADFDELFFRIAVISFRSGSIVFIFFFFKK